MSGFVGSRARKRRRNIFIIFGIALIIIPLFLIFPTLENNNIEIIPNDNIVPNLSEDLTSLASNIEELELNLFQKDQKIKFRDGQIKNLQTELKETKSKYDSAILELTEIKNDLRALSSNNENLIQPDRLKSLQDKFNKLNLENDKNISLIKKLNNKIDDLNNNIQSNDINSNDLLNENQKLKKDKKNIFAQKIKLDNNIIELKEKISEQEIKIESYLEEIKKLKDKSHHGR
jgi:chromosome segregation ATPase